MFLVCTMLMSLTSVVTPLSVSAEDTGTCGENLTWKLDDMGVLTISGSGAMNHFQYGTSPWNAYKEIIESVVIEEGVTTIGAYAFGGCTSLKSAMISSSVTSIGRDIFFGCYGLSNIAVNENNAYYISVDGVLFDKSMKTLIKYPNGKYMDNYQVPDGVSTLSSRSFYDCIAINTLSVPASVVEIGWGAFMQSSIFVNVDNTNNMFCSLNGSLFSKDMKTMLYYYDTFATTIVIPEGVSVISEELCSQNSTVERIVFPEGVTEIQGYAFSWCENLRSVYLPASLEKIEQYGVFADANISNVYYGGNSIQWKAIEFEGGQDNDAFNIFSKATIHFNRTPPFLSGTNPPTETAPPRSGIIGDGLVWALNDEGVFTVTGNGAMNLTRLYFSTPWERIKQQIKEVVIEEGVTDVGYSAFRYCRNLKKVTLPQSVTKLHHDAFAYCYSLNEINLPQSLAWMSSGIFYRNYSLRKLCIPLSLTYMGMMTFIGCNFETFSYEGTPEQWQNIEFESFNIGVYSGGIEYLSKTPQNIIVDELPIKEYGDSSFKLQIQPDAVSKLTEFSYESSNPEVAKIDADGTVRIVGAGECNITIRQAGNEEYLSFIKVIKLVVNPLTVTVTNVDLQNKIATLNGILEEDIGRAEVNFARMKTTVTSTQKTTTAGADTVVATVKLSDFKLKGEKAKNYITADTEIVATVTTGKVSESLSSDKNITVEAARVADHTIVVTDVRVLGVPEDHKVSIDTTAIADGNINTVAISTAVLDNVKDNETGSSLAITLKDGSEDHPSTVTFDSDALSAIRTNADSADTLSILVKKAENDELKDAQIAKVAEVSAKNPAVYSLDVIDETGESVATSFGTGVVTAELPYAMQLENGNVVVKHLADSGSITEVSGVTYDDTTQTITVPLEHFSEYLIYTEYVSTNTTYQKLDSENEYQFTITANQPFFDEKIYIAAYDLNGMLLSLSPVDFMGSTETKVNIPFSPAISYAKIFVWDSQMQPAEYPERVEIVE